MVRQNKRKDRSRKNRKSKTRRNNMRRNRTQKGAGWGFTGTESIPGTPGIVSNPQVFTNIGDCRAAKPDYWISDYAPSQKGLPGMSGGKRRKRRTMKGGRYGFDPAAISEVTPNGAAWWAGTYSPIQRIACEGSTPNPLNPSPHTPSTQPLPVASSSIPDPTQSGGKRKHKQRGGAQNLAPATYGVGNVDSMYYYAPTAGYANQASTWVDSVGAPVQIQVPFAARSMNQACLTTGGPPPLTGALQKGGNFLNNLKNKTKQVSNYLGVPSFTSTTPAPNAPPLEDPKARAMSNEMTSLLGPPTSTPNTIPTAPPLESTNKPTKLNMGMAVNEDPVNVPNNTDPNPLSGGRKKRKTKKSRKHKQRKGRKGSRKH